MAKRPLVGVICCTRIPEDPAQAVAERYLRAIPFMGADAVLVPSMSDHFDVSSIVARLDGLMLTGSPSNIEPRRYRSREGGAGPFDPPRDETAMRLIDAAADQDRPVLGICRGFQEIAVAYRATLRRDLGEPDRDQIHHTPAGLPMEEMFALQHRVELSRGGILERAMGAPSIVVTSAHFQGIAELSPELVVEATSTDGIIESVRPASGERVLAVQWHPEWRIAENADSRKLFAWFGMLLRGATLEEAADRAAREEATELTGGG
ncbi:gamma-glutamyl-gamma-aminobutyrate hydrolase family protein [Methyloceanibacter sp.]|uniref:gamma-glutamyl-gamma-aminobutyrate hydrolase family protein n=1 Tax=Methyloceanibacter sp. TaxID=1965321 RepID=UPI002D2B88B6|nr:gamma-glutamyl-gamma-aminobutyrate hydrolase family protein [Methyloceanibacter sp.]HZP09964.1 gamma-glutamyl-gamma-aminobutyrate hydrolase family protein [Methyloceanibacter sp.]